MSKSKIITLKALIEYQLRQYKHAGLIDEDIFIMGEIDKTSSYTLLLQNIPDKKGNKTIN